MISFHTRTKDDVVILKLSYFVQLKIDQQNNYNVSDIDKTIYVENTLKDIIIDFDEEIFALFGGTLKPLTDGIEPSNWDLILTFSSPKWAEGS